MERERERESFALLSSISTASPYRPNLIHLCRPTGVLARNFVPTDFVEEQFRFRTKRRKESSSSFLLQFSSFFLFRGEGKKGRKGGDINLRSIREREREKERERRDGRRQTWSARVEVERAKSELKERERVAAAGGSANRFKRISVSHGPVTIVKTESTAIRF